MSELSQNIYRTGRICTGLTQEAAAEQIGVAAETLRAYEAGRRIPPPVTLWSGWWSATTPPPSPTAISGRRAA